jgi:hypothetical protein
MQGVAAERADSARLRSVLVNALASLEHKITRIWSEPLYVATTRAKRILMFFSDTTDKPQQAIAILS